MRATLCLTVLCLLGAADLHGQWRCGFGCERDRDRDRHDRGWRSDAGPVQFGVRGGYDFDEEVGLAGAQVRIPVIRGLGLAPSADVFFGDAATDWQLNADVLAAPDALGGIYAGVGAAFARRDFDVDGDEETEVGYNLLVGLDAGRVLDTRLRPFAEARWTGIEDGYDPFRLVAGFNVPI